MKDVLIDAVMNACRSGSGVTFQASDDEENHPHLFWPTLLEVVGTSRLYHGAIEFYLFEFFDNADGKRNERLSIDHVDIDEEGVSVEGIYDGEDFWFSVVFHPPEDAVSRGQIFDDGKIIFDDGRAGQCDDEEDDDPASSGAGSSRQMRDEDDSHVDTRVVCNEPYMQILKDPPLSLRCSKRKGHKDDHGQGGV